jgi:hypothetical protein
MLPRVQTAGRLFSLRQACADLHQKARCMTSGNYFLAAAREMFESCVPANECEAAKLTLGV